MPLRDDLARLNYMGIVFQSGVYEMAPEIGLGYYKGMIYDEPACIFCHFGLHLLSR